MTEFKKNGRGGIRKGAGRPKQTIENQREKVSFLVKRAVKSEFVTKAYLLRDQIEKGQH